MASTKKLPPQKSASLPSRGGLANKINEQVGSKTKEAVGTKQVTSTKEKNEAIDRRNQEEATKRKSDYDNEQSGQWNKSTKEMKTPNVMYDDRTPLAGKYAEEAGRAARDAERNDPNSSYSRSQGGRSLRM
jgi:hypothetical protein